MAQPSIDTLSEYVTDFIAGTRGLANKRQEVVSFIAGGSITAGNAVAFDTNQTTTGIVNVVVNCGVVSTVGNPLCIGVALTSASTGGIAQVVVAGLHPAANVLTAVAAGAALIAAPTTAGRFAANVAAATAPVSAVCLATSVNNVAPVWVVKSY